jgi:lipoate-protein ligase A
LWQNERTVVIGKNQNPWKECRIAELEADGGRLVRRLSGGGAVFHDLGNLNFTFFATKENYSVERQLQVILEAVRGLGIPAEKTGRNDISVEGRKFSGNAFFSDGKHCYHHGTILVNVDMSMLSHYLNVSREKLVSKGVESVRSRVTNLTEYNGHLTIGLMKQELIEAFRRVYGLEVEEIRVNDIDPELLHPLEQKFSSWEWLYGKKMEFNYSLNKRFTWGDLDLRFEVESGMIRECVIYSDSLVTGIFEELAAGLKNVAFSTSSIVKVLETVAVTEETQLILSDFIEFVKYENI